MTSPNLYDFDQKLQRLIDNNALLLQKFRMHLRKKTKLNEESIDQHFQNLETFGDSFLAETMGLGIIEGFPHIQEFIRCWAPRTLSWWDAAYKRQIKESIWLFYTFLLDRSLYSRSWFPM